MKIIIIGAGIGGLTAALALGQCGFDPEVYEQADKLLDVGSAIAIWPNAMRILQRLGVGERILENAGVIEKVEWHGFDGNVFGGFSFPESDTPAIALHRADLQHALVNALPERSIHLGRTFLSANQKGKKVEAEFADGTSVTCDALIGADGLHSRTRSHFLDGAPPIYRGYTVWRGIAPAGTDTVAQTTAMEVYGRGQRFGIGPVGLGRTGWWATANEGEGDQEPAVERQAKLLTLFGSWRKPVPQLIEATPSDSILHNPAYDRPPDKRWGERQITLLGDAAHPATPNLGQGGCMAIEDAVVLARCIDKYGNPVKAFRSYENVRHRRTAAITRYSLRYGTVGQWESAIATRVREKALALIPESLARRVVRLVFDFDPYSIEI
jgi:2-polyprenyl-6-methoxyphenol hydroxylase-like FAD-dependent oxidoreductase